MEFQRPNCLSTANPSYKTLSKLLTRSSEIMRSASKVEKKAKLKKQRDRLEKVYRAIKAMLFLLGFISIIVLIYFATRSRHVHLNHPTTDNAKKQRTAQPAR